MTIYNFVYQTTNKINDKIYVGVHRTEKLDDGYLGSGKALKRAVKKYGKENFTRRILSMHATYDAALVEEGVIVTEDFAKRKDTYNIKMGGIGGLHSEASRLKMSKSQTGRTHSAETKKKIAMAAKGRRKSAESRRKISEANTGRRATAETRAKQSAARKGMVHSAASKAKMSAAKMGKPRSEETKRKLSIAHRGKTLSEEHKKNISASSVGREGRTPSAETRAKISAARKGQPPSNKGVPHTEETKAKMRAAWARRRGENS